MLYLNIVGISEESQIIPFWTGFNSFLSKPKNSYTAVAYPPVIDAKPNDMATIYTAMKRCEDMCSQLGQEFSIQTMDQQLYAIAQQVKWSASEEFDNHVIRLGGFHSLCCYIAAIGKLWADGGLRDLLVESEVYAGCTVDQMLAGKQFNRSVRGLILTYEALTELWLCSFFKWCELEQHIHALPNVLWQQIEKAQQAIKEKSLEAPAIVDVLNEILSDHLEPLFTCFQYWDMYLKAIEIMLENIRAERVGDWEQHIASSSKMLTYFFSTNRTNYSRWMPIYLLDMMNLPEEIASKFKAGQFPVRQTPGKFNGIWSDMGVEKTVIKDSKGSGGIVGLTRKKAAMVRWSLTRHRLGEYAAAMRDRSGHSTSVKSQHLETLPAAMKRDEEHLIALTTHLREKMTDPFNVNDHPDVLMNISTGVHAPPEIQESLLNAVEMGQKEMEKFVESALSKGGIKSFYAPIPKSKLKTFTELSKKTNIKLHGGKGVTLHVNISPELVFRRALTLAKSREGVNVDSVLAHPVGPVPTALFHEDGTLRKSSKAELGHKLEELVTEQAGRPTSDTPTVHIRDAMASIQAMDGNRNKTFGDLANEYMANLVKGLKYAEMVVDVFDRYDNPDFVKVGERERRANSVGFLGREYEVIAGRAIPHWKRFLSVSANKQSLTKFLCSYLSDNIPKEWPSDQQAGLS